MFDIGMGECMVVVLVALLIFGPQKLSDIAERLGRMWGNWQRTFQQFSTTAAQVKDTESFEQQGSTAQTPSSTSSTKTDVS